MVHMRLLYRLTEKKTELFGVASHNPDEAGRIFVSHAMKESYLMSLLLGVAALHQSTEAPDTCDAQDMYNTSMELLGVGLGGFNKATLDIDDDNAATVFLASSAVALYTRCDTFGVPRNELPEDRLDRIIRLMLVSHGSRAVMSMGNHWELLARSIILPMLGLDLINGPHHTQDDSTPLVRLFDLLKACNLPDQERDDCAVAVGQLLRTYGADPTKLNEIGPLQYLRASAWPTPTTNLYVDMLVRRVPEALIILAHWGVLLHPLRELWGIKQAGEMVVSTVAGLLAPEWQHWLDYPQTVIAGTQYRD